MLYIKANSVVSSALESAFTSSVSTVEDTHDYSYLDAVQACHESVLEAQMAMYDMVHFDVEMSTKTVEAYTEAGGNTELLESYMRPVTESFMESAVQKVKNFLTMIYNAIEKAVTSVWGFIRKIITKVRTKISEWLKKKDKEEGSEAKGGEEKKDAAAAPGIPVKMPVGDKVKVAAGNKSTGGSGSTSSSAKHDAYSGTPAKSSAPDAYGKMFPIEKLISFMRDVKVTANMVKDFKNDIGSFLERKANLSDLNEGAKILGAENIMTVDNNSGKISLSGDPMQTLMKANENSMVELTRANITHWNIYLDKHDAEIKEIESSTLENIRNMKKIISNIQKTDAYSSRSKTWKEVGDEESVKQMNENIKYNTAIFTSYHACFSKIINAVMKIWSDESSKIIKYMAKALGK